MRTASARTTLSEQRGFKLAGSCSLDLLCRAIRIKHQQNHNPKFSGSKWKVKITLSNSTLPASTASQVITQLHTHILSSDCQAKLPKSRHQGHTAQCPNPVSILPSWGKWEEAAPRGAQPGDLVLLPGSTGVLQTLPPK